MGCRILTIKINDEGCQKDQICNCLVAGELAAIPSCVLEIEIASILDHVGWLGGESGQPASSGGINSILLVVFQRNHVHVESRYVTFNAASYFSRSQNKYRGLSTNAVLNEKKVGESTHPALCTWYRPHPYKSGFSRFPVFTIIYESPLPHISNTISFNLNEILMITTKCSIFHFTF